MTELQVDFEESFVALCSRDCAWKFAEVSKPSQAAIFWTWKRDVSSASGRAILGVPCDYFLLQNSLKIEGSWATKKIAEQNTEILSPTRYYCHVFQNSWLTPQKNDLHILIDCDRIQSPAPEIIEEEKRWIEVVPCLLTFVGLVSSPQLPMPSPPDLPRCRFAKTFLVATACSCYLLCQVWQHELTCLASV